MVLTSVVIHGGTVRLFHMGITSHETWKNDRKRRATEMQTIDTFNVTARNFSISSAGVLLMHE